MNPNQQQQPGAVQSLYRIVRAELEDLIIECIHVRRMALFAIQFIFGDFDSTERSEHVQEGYAWPRQPEDEYGDPIPFSFVQNERMTLVDWNRILHHYYNRLEPQVQRHKHFPDIFDHNYRRVIYFIRFIMRYLVRLQMRARRLRILGLVYCWLSYKCVTNRDQQRPPLFRLLGELNRTYERILETQMSVRALTVLAQLHRHLNPMHPNYDPDLAFLSYYQHHILQQWIWTWLSILYHFLHRGGQSADAALGLLDQVSLMIWRPIFRFLDEFQRGQRGSGQGSGGGAAGGIFGH